MKRAPKITDTTLAGHVLEGRRARLLLVGSDRRGRILAYRLRRSGRVTGGILTVDVQRWAQLERILARVMAR